MAPNFLARVVEELGVELEIVDRETEAHLAAAGCAALADQEAKGIVLFDIGGGSTEVVWLAGGAAAADPPLRERVRIWTSLQMGSSRSPKSSAAITSMRRDLRGHGDACHTRARVVH